MKKRFIVVELALIFALTLLLAACGAVSESKDELPPEEENAVVETLEPAKSEEPAKPEATPAPQKDEPKETAQPETTPVETAQPDAKPVQSENNAAQPAQQTGTVPAATPTPVTVPPTPVSTPTPTAPAPTHTHDWQPVYTTVHHDAVTEEVWVVDQPACEAWDEYIYGWCAVCKCGAQFGTYREWEAHSNSYDWTDEMSAHSSYGSGQWITDTVHHDAVEEIGHYETAERVPAYDEQVLDHYACPCGETKQP